MSVFLLIVVIVGVRHGHGRHAHEELREAKKVVIVGGGLVGVELAAEIAFAVTAPPLSCFLSTPVPLSSVLPTPVPLSPTLVLP